MANQLHYAVDLLYTSITCTDGEFWKTQRSFVITHLRDLGLGKKTMEFMIKEEISQVLKTLQVKGHDTQLGKLLAPFVLNILWVLTTGSRFDIRDPRLNKLLEILELRSKAFDMSGGILTKYPWLRYIAPKRSGYDLIKRLNNELKNLLTQTITEHHKKWSEGRNDDLIYSFIAEMKKANEHETTFTEDQLIMGLLRLVYWWFSNTSNTLDFAFLMMILNPDIQRKVHECLDKAFGDLENVTYGDRLRIN
ncbi:hypothetical protein NQ317_017738 [Molorchus minor]|uniref:Cytochrome P450 n=1 Tax=Molorchus minor TaxID=1323400 RepID=A0ABQ9J0N5_9CUCU|nr:hypothetical protein NQ317_017738 [Molorchus minor]